MMRMDAAAYDNSVLYTTNWIDRAAPQQAQDGWRPQTTNDRVVVGELERRGLRPADVRIDAMPEILVIRNVGCSGIQPVSMDRHGVIDDEALRRLRNLLDIQVGSLCLLRMLDADGWEPGAPLPAWACLTTALGELVLDHLAGAPDVRSDASNGSRPAMRPYIPGPLPGDLPDGVSLSRVGSLLKVEATLGRRIAVSQADGTRVALETDDDGLQGAELSRLLATTRDHDPMGIGPFLSGFPVKGVRVSQTGGTRIAVLEVAMQVTTLAPIPIEAMASAGIRRVTARSARLPIWTQARTLER